MYGTFEISDFQAEFGNFRIKVERDGKLYRYVREGKERVENVISSNSSKLIINPVEPVNLPKNITNFLQINLSKKIILEPGLQAEVYVKFPIEVGVFLASKKKIEVVDVFSLQKPKYSLYGSPSDGVVCRYWESEVFFKKPEIDPLKEGIIRLKVENKADEWVSLKSLVFDVYGMKIYYNSDSVISFGEVELKSERVGETTFLDRKSVKGMRKSVELFTARKVPIVRKSFVMEMGL